MSVNITDTAGLTDAINTEVIDPLIMDYAYEATVLPSLVRQKDITGQGSLTAKFAAFDVVSAGAQTPGTDLTPADLDSVNDGTLTVGDVAVALEVQDLLMDVLAGRISMDDLARQLGNAVAAKLSTDIAALFP